MRHPDADNIRQTCRDALPAVLRSLGLRADEPFELDTAGWVNVCFLGRDVVVRFNARDPELPKFDREEWAMRVLNDRGFPVARVVGRVDNSRMSPYPVLVTHRIAGENLEATWDQLDAGQEVRLAEQAGTWLARLHQQKLAGFGEVFRATHDNQRAFWGECAMDWLVACTDLFDAHDLERMRKSIDAAAANLEQLTEARLVHRDYHFGNLLHDGDNIVGILDFEWAVAGDPLLDRVSWASLDEACPGALEPFVRGYRRTFGETTESPADVAFYELTNGLELCDVAARFLSDEEREDYVARTLVALERLERALHR